MSQLEFLITNNKYITMADCICACLACDVSVLILSSQFNLLGGGWLDHHPATILVVLKTNYHNFPNNRKVLLKIQIIINESSWSVHLCAGIFKCLYIEILLYSEDFMVKIEFIYLEVRILFVLLECYLLISLPCS